MDNIGRAVLGYLSEAATSSVEGVSGLQSFCEKVKKNSLNVKVHEALTFRKQGHFDKAMLYISEVNRDQVIAIRKIQSLKGEITGEQYPEVVFGKFRQFEPFEIGLSEAEPVLSILAELDYETHPELEKIRTRLHDCELQREDGKQYLLFLEGRFDDGSHAEEIDQTKQNIATFGETLSDLRLSILEKIFFTLGGLLKQIPSGLEKDRVFLLLSQNIFLVVTSPILTKHEANVETEM